MAAPQPGAGWAALYPVLTFGVVLFWLPLFLAPSHPRTLWLARHMVGPCVMAVVYTGLLLGRLASGEDSGGDMWSLAGVMALFRSDWVMLMGWDHYLATDLACANWQVIDSHLALMARRHALALGAPRGTSGGGGSSGGGGGESDSAISSQLGATGVAGVGAVVVGAGVRGGMAWWARVPCLVLTYVFGPAGLLLYLLARQLPAANAEVARANGAAAGFGKERQSPLVGDARGGDGGNAVRGRQ